MRVEFFDSESSMLLYTLEKIDIYHINHLLKQVSLYQEGSLDWSDMLSSLIDPLSIKIIPLVYEERSIDNLVGPSKYVVRLDSSEEEYTSLAMRMRPIFPLYGKMLKQLLTNGRPQKPEYLKRELAKYGLNRFGKLRYVPSLRYMAATYDEDPIPPPSDPVQKQERWVRAKGYLDSLGKGDGNDGRS